MEEPSHKLAEAHGLPSFLPARTMSLRIPTEPIGDIPRPPSLIHVIRDRILEAAGFICGATLAERAIQGK